LVVISAALLKLEVELVAGCDAVVLADDLGADDVLLLPLLPQAASTTASATGMTKKEAALCTCSPQAISDTRDTFKTHPTHVSSRARPMSRFPAAAILDVPSPRNASSVLKPGLNVAGVASIENRQPRLGRGGVSGVL
jgi:hypothetical protein